ncbi:NAD(P)/FAD-dependent oxidoreductase [Falsigemmobacter faecalis]|uniref:FAD-binding oxidoreductase n=1 Tax=Falsigemmobacter faecalis TaxID=2488730 RepID=A0A3P3DLK2_9RHOB|nr:FAD-dependent oxidoreductase [Falsigemmobacter faecalis]RRH75127.1 FAD-binding oxidoreductase [Falsigemmobacter faecalis]
MTAFPFAETTPLRFRDDLPEACDLVILGGGVIGVSTAIFAARKGLKVVLCEKGLVAGEQSSRNWGWIRQQGRDLGELPIVMEANRHWRAFDQEIGGDHLGFRITGILKAARSEAAMARYERWLDQAKLFGVDSRMVSKAEMQSLTPGAAVDYAGGLTTPSDGRAEPWVAVPLLAELARALGVVIREHCAVRALDLTGGVVTGVETEAGRIRAGQVLVAAGAWSRLFLGQHGVKFPQLSVLSSVAATTPVPSLFPGGYSDGDYAFRTRKDGGLTLAPGSEHDFFIGPDAFASFFPFLPTLKQDFKSTHFGVFAPKGFPDAWSTNRRWTGESPFERMRILNPRPNLRTLGRAKEALIRAFPAARDLQFRTTWAGMIDTMPDVVPIVDHVPGLGGVILATGMAGHGFGIGPGFGRILADMATGGAAGHDMSRFRFGRFSDGSKIDMGAAL